LRSLGIDLSAQPNGTAACLVRWAGAVAVVDDLQQPATDEDLLRLAQEADWVGIDAPFGWPDAFAAAVSNWSSHGGWTGADSELLAFRLTDRLVRQRVGRWPLSVSSDKLGRCAWRCCALLDRLEVADRTGNDNVIEVYPGAALSSWGFDHRRYKSTRAAERDQSIAARADLLRSFENGSGGWLVLAERHRHDLERSPHALDALVCAFIARAAAVGETLLPTCDVAEIARREGWIHLPTGGSFAQLGSA